MAPTGEKNEEWLERETGIGEYDSGRGEAGKGLLRDDDGENEEDEDEGEWRP